MYWPEILCKPIQIQEETMDFDVCFAFKILINNQHISASFIVRCFDVAKIDFENQFKRLQLLKV